MGHGAIRVPVALVVAAVVVGLVVLLAGGRDGADHGLLLAATATPSPASVAAPGGPGTVVAPSSAAAASVPVAPAAAEPSGSTSEPPATGVTVHVVGAVEAPGLVELPAAARVADALEAAGGPAADADLARVNLARPLIDGEQVFVPRPGEVLQGAPAVLPPGSAGQGPANDAGPTGTAPEPVDLNTAGVAELDTLPGVGPVLAQRIVAWRTEVGPFTTVEDLTAVSGIGDALVAGLVGVATV